ncbi:MAG: peptidoglycan-binding protein [Candidatus Ventricola sp.]
MKEKIIGAAALMLTAVLLAATAYAACPSDEDHRYGPWRTKTSATCTRQGHQFRYCQKCDHWEQRYTPKLPHTVEEMTVTKEPTCTETGRKEGVCSVCGNTVRKTIDKLPHEYGDMTVVKEPTCTQDGKGERSCTVCGRVTSETIPSLGHDWGKNAVTKEPTCTASGTSTAACTRCGQTQTEKIAPLVHVFGAWTVTQEPEGKQKGVREHACTLCGLVRSERFYAEGTLYEDMEPCKEVIVLQERLRDLGYYSGSIRSGTFGSLTAKAVMRFQQEHGLGETGLADTATRQAIDDAWEQATGKRATVTLDAAEMENAAQAQTMDE